MSILTTFTFVAETNNDSFRWISVWMALIPLEIGLITVFDAISTSKQTRLEILYGNPMSNDFHKSFQFRNFSEAMFYENYLTSDFHTNTLISRRVCLLVKMASKTVIRPIRI